MGKLSHQYVLGIENKITGAEWSTRVAVSEATDTQAAEPSFFDKILLRDTKAADPVASPTLASTSTLSSLSSEPATANTVADSIDSSMFGGLQLPDLKSLSEPVTRPASAAAITVNETETANSVATLPIFLGIVAVAGLGYALYSSKQELTAELKV